MRTPLIELFTERGRIQLHLYCLRMGQDLCVTLSGGDRAHIGAVALSQPNAKEKTGVTTAVIALPGHREENEFGWWVSELGGEVT